MSESHGAARCGCTNAAYSRNYVESEPDDATDTRESAAEARDADATKSLTDSRVESSPALSRDTSHKSIAVQVLRKVDPDRTSRISVQNLKLSLLFPEASPRSLITTIAIPFFYLVYRNLCMTKICFRTDVLGTRLRISRALTNRLVVRDKI